MLNTHHYTENCLRMISRSMYIVQHYLELYPSETSRTCMSYERRTSAAPVYSLKSFTGAPASNRIRRRLDAPAALYLPLPRSRISGRPAS